MKLRKSSKQLRKKIRRVWGLRSCMKSAFHEGQGEVAGQVLLGGQVKRRPDPGIFQYEDFQ